MLNIQIINNLYKKVTCDENELITDYKEENSILTYKPIKEVICPLSMSDDTINSVYRAITLEQDAEYDDKLIRKMAEMSIIDTLSLSQEAIDTIKNAVIESQDLTYLDEGEYNRQSPMIINDGEIFKDCSHFYFPKKNAILAYPSVFNFLNVGSLSRVPLTEEHTTLILGANGDESIDVAGHTKLLTITNPEGVYKMNDEGKYVGVRLPELGGNTDYSDGSNGVVDMVEFVDFDKSKIREIIWRNYPSDILDVSDFTYDGFSLFIESSENLTTINGLDMIHPSSIHLTDNPNLGGDWPVIDGSYIQNDLNTQEIANCPNISSMGGFSNLGAASESFNIWVYDNNPDMYPMVKSFKNVIGRLSDVTTKGSDFNIRLYNGIKATDLADTDTFKEAVVKGWHIFEDDVELTFDSSTDTPSEDEPSSEDTGSTMNEMSYRMADFGSGRDAQQDAWRTAVLPFTNTKFTLTMTGTGTYPYIPIEAYGRINNGTIVLVPESDMTTIIKATDAGEKYISISQSNIYSDYDHNAFVELMKYAKNNDAFLNISNTSTNATVAAYRDAMVADNFYNELQTMGSLPAVYGSYKKTYQYTLDVSDTPSRGSLGDDGEI